MNFKITSHPYKVHASVSTEPKPLIVGGTGEEARASLPSSFVPGSGGGEIRTPHRQ